MSSFEPISSFNLRPTAVRGRGYGNAVNREVSRKHYRAATYFAEILNCIHIFYCCYK